MGADADHLFDVSNESFGAVVPGDKETLGDGDDRDREVGRVVVEQGQPEDSALCGEDDSARIAQRRHQQQNEDFVAAQRRKLFGRKALEHVV